jgi:hypothetical protein
MLDVTPDARGRARVVRCDRGGVSRKRSVNAPTAWFAAINSRPAVREVAAEKRPAVRGTAAAAAGRMLLTADRALSVRRDRSFRDRLPSRWRRDRTRRDAALSSSEASLQKSPNANAQRRALSARSSGLLIMAVNLSLTISGAERLR